MRVSYRKSFDKYNFYSQRYVYQFIVYTFYKYYVYSSQFAVFYYRIHPTNDYHRIGRGVSKTCTTFCLTCNHLFSMHFFCLHFRGIIGVVFNR